MHEGSNQQGDWPGISSVMTAKYVMHVELSFCISLEFFRFLMKTNVITLYSQMLSNL
ncbi:hypothetical protein RchiOBHm_Chr4g0421841 [Rosa chinensis]|uniref:Uncharacterized protein n=1 Tax=Rosa chinensis TaxID=74649 RepID=A0A2P6QYC4_ROSCH|nr:hypothetical protein RchiOBHm_Chr4g0421841 [Rosa chinensis]